MDKKSRFNLDNLVHTTHPEYPGMYQIVNRMETFMLDIDTMKKKHGFIYMINDVRTGKYVGMFDEDNLIDENDMIDRERFLETTNISPDDY